MAPARLAIIIAIAGLAARPARADDDRMEQARHQVEAADIDYKLGRFTEALAQYSKAYELYPAAPLLFNIGQCHRNLKDYERAIFFFEGYLRDNPSASNRQLVLDLIRESKAELEQATRRADEEAKRRAHEEARRRADEEEEAKRRAHDGDHTPLSRALPVGLIAGGATVFVGGTVFYYYGQKRGPNEMFVYDDTRILGGTMMVLGTAAAITGTILLVRHPSSAPIAGVTSNSAYVGWAGRF